MNKRLILFPAALMVSLTLCAQWNTGDTVRLRNMLNSPGEIKLNPNVVKMIDFGSAFNKPIYPNNPALKFDETLPEAVPEKKGLGISLMPYTANTRFNHDPIYGAGKDVRQLRSLQAVLSRTIPANWAKNWMDGTFRKSREEIEAAGVREVMGVERRNNVYVNSYAISPLNGNSIALGGGKTWTNTASGSAIGGLDLMTVFTKEFWDKAGGKRRKRTLDVLKNYGDSTTVLINHEIINPLTR